MSAGFLAHRAAAQAVAALLYGAPMEDVRRTGIRLSWPSRTSRRIELVTELMVALSGVAAVSRCGFSRDEPTAPFALWSFNHSQLSDLRRAQRIVGELDPAGEDDVLFLAWRQALELVNERFNWRMIEKVALYVSDRPLEPTFIKDFIQFAVDWIAPTTPRTPKHYSAADLPDIFDDMDCRPGPSTLDPDYSDSVIPEHMRSRIIAARRARRAEVEAKRHPESKNPKGGKGSTE